MNRIAIGFIALGAAAGATILAAAPGATPQKSGFDVAHPVVVELFQSQGCSSCPPANVVLNAIADRPGVLALNFSVTYWDRLGWKDTFGQQAFTDRQREYSGPGKPGNVQTPQMIINGRGAVLGSFKPQVEAALAKFARGTGGPSVTSANGAITVGGGSGSATVWLVDYDPRAQRIAIGSGENGGRTLVHRNIVRRLTPLGSWSSRTATFRQPATSNGLARAVLVQSGKGGPIIAAAKI